MAKEIKTNVRFDLIAATPPLEAMKVIIHLAASSDDPEMCLMHNDVSRAYFHAKATRKVYVDIAPEDREHGDEWRCGRLNLSMYGSRDAASNWESTYAGQMIGMEFNKGKASPCLFDHPIRNIYTVVHGDYYFSVGRYGDLVWMKEEMEKAYTLKSKIIGGKPGMEKK